MKIAIYEIEKQYINLAEQIIDNDGELTEELELALAINKEQLENKGQCYAYVIKELEAFNDAVDIEIKRLQALKKSRGKTVDRLKETIIKAMDLFEVTELKTPTLKINFRKSDTVEIENEALLDTAFLVTKTTVTPDKVAIKKAIKAGEFVTGAVLVEHNNLQIK